MNKFALNANCESCKSIVKFIDHQNNIFSKVDLYDCKDSNYEYVFDMDIDINIRSIDGSRILLLDEDPYIRKEGESFQSWRNRMTLVHNSICRYKKIIATSIPAFKSLSLKHSQKIFYDELPLALRVFKKRLTENKTSNGKFVFVVNDHFVYKNNYDKLKINNNLEVITLSEYYEFGEVEYSTLVGANVVYWLSNKSAFYNDLKIDSEVLSLAGIMVNVDDVKAQNTFFGQLNSIKLMRLKGINKLVHFNKGFNWQASKNLFYNYLEKHAG